MSRRVPVVVIAYGRRDLLAVTLGALRANGVTLIHAYSDGPRGAADEAKVAGVRDLLRSVDWAELKLVERPVNVGLDANVIGGVDDTLAQYGEAIVCEEDIEFAPGVYAYMCEALDHYRADARVMSIGGWTHPRMTPPDVRDAPYFSGRFTEWGWATWSRAWQGFAAATAGELRDRCNARGIDMGRYGRDILDWYAVGVEKVGWDYRFNLHEMLHGGLHLMPARAMTLHIGNEQFASHPQDRSEWNDRFDPPPPPGTIHWPDVREHPESAALWRRAMEPPSRPSLGKRIWRRLMRMMRGAPART